MKIVFRTLENDFGFLLLIVLAFSLGLAVVEFVWEWRSKRLTQDRMIEMGASVSVAIPSAIMDGVFQGLIIAGYLAFYKWIPWKWEIGWTSLLVALILADFIHYWTHRWEHEIRLLWAHHSVHHSSHVYNYSTALRVVFIRTFYDSVYYLPLVLLGVHPLLIFLSLAMIAFYQIWLHTELIRTLGPLEWVLNTPSHHRVHHGSNEIYLDKNYGGILILWDRMFGTFQREEEQAVYGLTEPINSAHPWNVHFHEYRRLWHDIRHASSWSTVYALLSRGPGWRPSDDSPAHSTQKSSKKLHTTSTTASSSRKSV